MCYLILQAFFTPEYAEKHPEDMEYVAKLKGLILAQVPIVGECLRVCVFIKYPQLHICMIIGIGSCYLMCFFFIQIHREKVPENLKPLHQKLEQRYQEFLEHLQAAYGMNVRVCKVFIHAFVPSTYIQKSTD